jgi:LPS export ABC transporter permease LptF/LPS export ABC transporter permease LptG
MSTSAEAIGRGRPTFILWRHVIREILPPALLAFLIFTFLLLMRYLLQISRLWIQHGAELDTVLWSLVYSLPHIVVLTLPMGVLVGGLLAFGRMSSDFEIVAMRAQGLSLLNLVPPVLLFGALTWALNGYLFLVAMPWGNASLREIQWEVITQRAFSSEFEPRVFNEDFPDLVLYIEDIVDQGREWQGVFAAQTEQEPPTIIRAERAFPVIDEAERRTYLMLENGTIVSSATDPRDVTITRFGRQSLLVWSEDENSVLGEPGKDGRSMTLPELLEAIEARQATGDPAWDFLVEVHKKFSFPFACLIMALISLPLGASTQRQTTAFGFGIGTAVIMLYYFLTQYGEQMAEVGKVSPWLGMWAANIVLGSAAAVLMWMKTRERDLGIMRRLRPYWERAEDGTRDFLRQRVLHRPALSTSTRTRASFPRTLDRYVLRNYSSILMLAFGSLTAVWVIVDWLDKNAYVTYPEFIAQYMQYQIFEILFEVIPIAAVITVLATFSLMTKSNEVTAALAGGISLYRLLVPILIPALLLTGARYVLQDYVLPVTTRQAEEILWQMHPPEATGSLQQEQAWAFSEGRRVFHFADYSDTPPEFRGLQVYYLTAGRGGIARVEYANRATWDEASGQWQAHDGWRRHFVTEDGSEQLAANPLEEFKFSVLPVPERPSYFEQTPLQPKEMSTLELRRHIERLRERGYDTDRALVDYHLKIANPFVVLVMTLVGVPFAFRSGRQGALTGVGIAIALVIVYFIFFALFRALGYAGQLPPPLAAWAPHLLFLALAGFQALGLRS